MKKVQFGISEQEAGIRLDKTLAGRFEELSRSYLQKLFKEGLILVNQRPVKGSFQPAVGDQVEFEPPPPKEPEVLPEPIPLDILYEDEDVICINKPKGMVVHPAAGHTSQTLVNALLYHCHGSLSGINGVLRPGIVHRIDMDTTGVLIACKNDQAHRIIAEQLKEHSITRKYRAIVWHNLKEDTGTIDAPLGRNPKDRLKMAVTPEGGKRAITHYRVLERFGTFTYIECCLETGRTHQIRVHMASIGHPLLGDLLYGPKNNPFHTDGQALHAMVLGFHHPKDGRYLEFTAPLPDYFEAILNTLRKRSH